MRFATTLFAAALSVQSATARYNGCLYTVKQGGSVLGSICIEFGRSGAIGQRGTLYGDVDQGSASRNLFGFNLQSVDSATHCDRAEITGPWNNRQTWEVSPAVCRHLRAV